MAMIAVFFFDWVVSHFMVPGRVESWVVIMDFKDVSITSIPIKQLKGFIQALQSNFRGRMFRLIAVNSPLLLRGLWTALWTWIDEYSR
mmetsp:Transcript_11598/g.17562  ORF Transcript_11598/g.17562 Transcript_11598/m.17562 type:complete len:88 (+) Transcript_11598:509-772(+)